MAPEDTTTADTPGAERGATQAKQKPRRGFVANVLIVGGGTVIAQVVSLLTSPVLARLFDPEAFGLATLFGTLCGVVGVLGSARYDMAILLPKDDEDGSAVLGLSVAIATIVAGLAAAALAVAGEAALALLGMEGLWPIAWVIPVGIFLQSLHSPLPLFAQRAQRFDLVTAARVFAQLATVGVSIGVGFAGYQMGRDLIYARTSTIMLLIPLPIALWILRDPRGAGWRKPSWQRIRNMASRYREFPLVNSWAALLDTVALNAPQLVLAALFSPSVVGLFAMAVRLVSLPCQFVSVAVGQVFYQHAAAAWASGDKAAFRASVDGVTRRLVTLGVLPVLLVALLGPPTIGFVFGAKWLAAGFFVTLLASETLAMFITSPIVPLMNVMEMHRFNVVIQGTMLALRAGSLYLGAKWTGTPEGALIAFAVIVPMGLALQQVVLLRACGLSALEFAVHLLKHATWAVPAAIVWWLTDRVWQTPYLVTAALTTAAGAPYVVLALRADPEAKQLLLRIAGRFIPALTPKG